MTELKASSLTLFFIVSKGHHLIPHLTRLKTDTIISLLDPAFYWEQELRKTQEDHAVQSSSCIK